MITPPYDSTVFCTRLRKLADDKAIRGWMRQVTRNANVYNCGQRDPTIYIVESGQVKTVTYSKLGKQCVLSLVTPGEMFGEVAFLTPERTETAIAMKTTVLKQIPCIDLLDALESDDLREDFIRYLARRVLEQQQTIANMVTMNSEQRLAVLLLYLARKLGHGSASNLRIHGKLTQEDLSAMVGTTRSRVGYFLKGFRDSGLLKESSHHSLVVNEPRLADYVHEVG